MPPLVLFGVVLWSQVIGGLGDHISILSIDSGGIRGIIPATVLDHLDKAVKAKDPTTSLADYFDVISGTGTGGLMSAVLAAPHSPHSKNPVFTPAQIIEFYMRYGPQVFNKSDPPNCPKYDGEFLRNITREILNETRLNETLTNVVIPTFDENKLQPVIFSNYKLDKQSFLNAKLSDIVLGTTATPTYFPPHIFENDHVGFNLIGGVLAAKNPAMAAVTEVIRHKGANKDLLLLSLGTGIAAKPKDMTHYYLSTIFPGLYPEDNYLRIEEYNLDPSLIEIDNADKTNMEKLEKVGLQLLFENVKRMDVDTFLPYELNQTNVDALNDFADKLYVERQLRLKRKSMEKGPRLLTKPLSKFLLME